MSSTLIAWPLVLFGALIVVLTHLRMRGESAAGTYPVGRALRRTHLGAGLTAVVLWSVFLAAPEDSALGGSLIGIVALAAWWVTAIAGLLILMRWLPARGRHVTRAQTDAWSDGAGLSAFAHLGILVVVLFLTWAYLTSAV